MLYARKTGGGVSPVVPREAVDRNIELVREYGASFGRWSARYREVLDRLTRDGRKLAAYGAGHLTCAFLNFHDVAEYFAFVVEKSAQGTVARQRAVSIGQTVGNDYVATSGLKVGDQLIVSGVQKIGDGAPVTPMPARGAAMAGTTPGAGRAGGA